MNQLAAMSKAFAGRTCRVFRREFDWLLYFDQGRAVVLYAPWRIIAQGQIAFANQDDGHRFGRAESIDGEAEANRLIGGRLVTEVTVEPIRSDLTVAFEQQTAIELFNGSSNYEAWQADFPTEQGNHVVIGRGGGGVSIDVR